MLLEVIARNRLGPGAEAGNGEDAIIRGGIDDDRSNPGDVHEFRLHDFEREEPVTPASIALPPASRMRKPASAARYWCGGDHVARAHEGRAMGLHVSLPSLVPRIWRSDFRESPPGFRCALIRATPSVVLVDRIHETNRIGRMERKPTGGARRHLEGLTVRSSARRFARERTAVKLAQTA